MQKYYSVLFIFYYLTIGCISFAQTTWYIDDASNTDDVWTTGAIGIDDPGCGTVGAPCATVQYIIDNLATANGDVYRIDAGTYTENDIYNNWGETGLTFEGAGTDLVTLDPSGANSHALYFNNNGDITVKNLTINDANRTSNEGAAIFFFNDDGSDITLTLENVNITNSGNTGGASDAAALYVVSDPFGDAASVASVDMTNCEIYGNSSNGRGGGLFIDGMNAGTHTISKCKFYGNNSGANGSAIFVLVGNTTISNSLFYENTASIANSKQGTIYLAGGTHSIYNCTVADNVALDNAGIVAINSTSVTVHNSIIYGNTADDLDAFNSSSMTVDHCIYGSNDDNTSGTYSITNSSVTDPLFVDASGDNYRPSASSPAIDQADATNVGTDDIENDPRTINDEDIGCYEGPFLLPVTLTSFHGVSGIRGTTLSWSTVSEVNSDYYEIQRSVDGSEFISIGTIAAAGFSSKLTNYSFTDYNFLSSCYYRLKQYDFDGSFTYSSTIFLSSENRTKVPEVKISPNPFTTEVEFSIEPMDSATISMFVSDLSGKIIWHGETSSPTFQTSFTDLHAGFYLLTFILPDGNVLRKQLIKN